MVLSCLCVCVCALFAVLVGFRVALLLVLLCGCDVSYCIYAVHV